MIKLIKQAFNKDKLASVLFVVILALIALLYNYQNIAFFRPQSTHQWRQADCASIVKNYYQGGMHLFNPEVHNLTSNKGKTGKAFTSETPLYYYSIAVLYHIFGPHESIFRIINTLLFLLGFFYLHRLMLLVIGNKYWSITLPLLFFTSPVLVYYGNSFISNPLALSFSIIGLFYFSKFAIEKKFKYFLFFILLFLFAGSLKVTAFFSFFAIGIYAIFEFISARFIENSKRIFTKPFTSILLLSIPVVLIGLWIIYAHIQNTQNKCYYFSTVTFPVWDLEFAEIKTILKQINKVWLNQYFHNTMLAFTGLELIFVAINFKKLPLFLKVFLPAILFEAFAFILLQFWTFKDHDYYTIGLFILPIIITTVAFYLLKTNYPKIYNSITLKSVVLILLLFNIYYAKGQINERYNGWWNNIKDYEDLHTIEPYLRQIGIKQSDTVISIPDYSNVSLYLMNQKGWTEYIEREFNKGKETRFNADSAGIQESITKGAKYLIVNGIDQLYKKPYLQTFCYNKKGQYKNVLIFDVHNSDTNFNLAQKTLIKTYLCNADTLSTDGKYYKSAEQLFEYGITQTSNEFFSGSCSCKLNKEHPYGMTIKIKDLNYGDSFKFKVWCKDTGLSKGELIAKLNGQNIIEGMDIIQEKNNWKQIKATAFIKDLNADSELVVFVYNANGNAFFDNFEIEHYSLTE